MSSMGVGPGGVSPLVNSLAGTGAQQKSAETNRVQRDGQLQKFQLDRADQFEKTVGDIGQSDGTDERDADGRMPWSFQRRHSGDAVRPDHEGDVPHAADPSAERGTQLDLDA